MRRLATPTTEADAYRTLERWRWGGAPRTCPRCTRTGRCSLLRPRGNGRRTRTGSLTERRVWFCGHCRRQFSVLVATALQGTKVPVAAWVHVIAAMCAGDVVAGADMVRLDVAGEARRLALRRSTVLAMVRRLEDALQAAGGAPVSAQTLLCIPPAAAEAVRRGARPKRLPHDGQVGPRADHG